MPLDNDTIEKLKNFMEIFEVVFHNDWYVSKCHLETPELYISNDGTFLAPNVKDEANNWGNRGSLLSSYRELSLALKDAGIDCGTYGPEIEAYAKSGSNHSE